MTMRPVALAVGAALLAGSPGPAQKATGVIRGRIEVQLPPAIFERNPGVSELGGAKARRPPDRRRSVVYLETAPRAAFEEPQPQRARIDQRNETFVPHVLAITVGTTVDFPNSDVTYHNVFSLSKAKSFDLGRYAAGRSKAVTFDRPGIVRVFCEIHSHMNAFILVFGHRFFSVTDAEGRYRIEGVPPGTYTVSVWNEALPGTSRSVTIPPAGGDVEHDVTLSRERERP